MVDGKVRVKMKLFCKCLIKNVDMACCISVFCQSIRVTALPLTKWSLGKTSRGIVRGK